MEEKKKRFKLPHPYVLIFLLIVLCTILTYVVPAGTYDRYVDEATGQTLIDPDTFHYVDQTPVSPFGMVQAIPTGMTEVGWITFSWSSSSAAPSASSTPPGPLTRAWVPPSSS